jgi:hypothetical protein
MSYKNKKYHYRLKTFQAFLLANYLWGCLSTGGSERRLERVTLSVNEPQRVEEAQSPCIKIKSCQKEIVLPLRVVEPGRLVVRAGAQVIIDVYLGWGEDRRLRVDPVEPNSPTVPPRVVNREIGQEEVEVYIPAGVGAGERLTLTYEWEWKHQGKPALIRTWRPLQPQMEDGHSPFARPVASPPPDTKLRNGQKVANKAS